MKRKNIFLLLLAAVFLLSLTGCNSDDGRVAELEAENAALQEQVDALNAQVQALTAQLDALGSTAGLSGWELAATAWDSGNGANVTLSAVPMYYQEGQSATFSIWLEGSEVMRVRCSWDGTAYTAAADLSAADGYCYYCILTSADGTQTEIDVNTPIHPTDEALIDLATSLASYCNLMVEDAAVESDTLTLTGGYAQVQLPRISASGQDVTCTDAALVLEFAGEEVGRQALTLVEGEGLRSYEADVASVSFTIPEMEDDQQLDLWLEVTLSDGSTMTTPGGSWYYNAGELFLVVG